jgi:hypothetical protein
MRRVYVAVVVCAAVLLLAAAAAAAAPRYAADGAKLRPHNPALSHGQAAPAAYVPLARRIITGTGAINITVYASNGQPEAGATVDWWVFTDTDYGTGEGTTDSSGHAELPGVPAADSENGEIAVDLASGDDGYYDLWNHSWSATGWTGALQAGNLPVTLVRSADTAWNSWEAARVWLYAHNAGGELHLAASNIARSGSSASGYARTIQTGPEELHGGAAYFWDNEGLELAVDGIDVGPGQTAAAAPTAYEADAQRLWLGGWGSGKPGSSAWVVMNDYPDGWVNAISGVADYPDTAKPKSFGDFTCTGADYESQRITIPSTAAPGYAYWVEVTHSNGPLDLWTAFQVCTLKSSRARVSRGASVSMSGIVPVKGHYGSKKGTPKYVTLYKTTSAKLARSQPKATGGNRTAAKWIKVGRVRTDGLGKYKLSTRPGKTTWYCAWYAGDAWYYGSWTSVTKVTVR